MENIKIYQISRYLLMLISVLTLSTFLPKFYWLLFDKAQDKPFIQYSCVKNDFIYRFKNEDNSIYITRKGDTISDEEYQKSLPFLYFRILYQNGTMPDSILGVKMDPHDINMTNFTFRFGNSEFNQPTYGLFPLFESENSDKENNLPTDFFRFSEKRIEFIDCNKNKIIEEKSERFTKELKNKYFEFPPKIVNGNTSLNKKNDDGYFIVDAHDHFFNLKMMNGEPLVTIIKIPRNLLIKSIHCVELRSREFSTLLISQNNEIYILLNEGLDAEILPITNFNTATDNLPFFGNMFLTNITVIGPTSIRSTIMDRDYSLVDYTEYNWTARQYQTLGKIASFLFPFEVNISETTRSFATLTIRKPHYYGLLFNAFLALLCALYFMHNFGFKNTVKKPEYILDVSLILAFGIFIFPACVLLRSIK